MLPLIPGVDCAGVVDAVGPQVSRWHVGDRVAAAGVMPLNVCAEDGSDYDGPQGMMGIKRPGGFAEMVARAGLRRRRVAANTSTFITPPWSCATCRRRGICSMHVAELKHGETVLIMGAGGNLGSIGIQIAKNVIGAHVIAAAGSDERAAARHRSSAPTTRINYTTHDISRRGDEDHRRQGRRRALRQHRQSRRCCRSRSMPSAWTAAWSPRARTPVPNVSIDFSHLYHKRITIKGRPGFTPSDLPDCLAAAAAEGKIMPQIERVLPLSRAAEAHRMVEAHEGQGKIVLDPTLG